MNELGKCRFEGGVWTRLAENVARSWAACDRAPDRFAPICADALATARPWEGFRLADLLASAVTGAPSGLRKPRAIFSDLPLIFYQDETFRIELLIWTDSSTKIHDHGFRGAFAILEGTSFHCRFSFLEAETEPSGFALGQLLIDDVALLRSGAVVQIERAPDFIHSAFHIDAPTATLVVRTHGGEPGLIQREYYAPGLALASEPFDPAATIVTDTMAMLARIDSDRAASELFDLSRSADAETLFRMFDAVPWERIDRAAARAAHTALLGRPWGAELLATLSRKAANQRLIALRARLKRPEQRLLLGAVALLEDKEAVLDLLAKADIADPAGLAADCILRASPDLSDDVAPPAEHTEAIRAALLGETAKARTTRPAFLQAAAAGPFRSLFSPPARRAEFGIDARLPMGRLCGGTG